MKKFILFLSAIFFLNPIMWAQSSETEPNDAFGDANTFALNSSITGQIGVSGDNYDWYKITTTKDGSLTIIGIPESSLNFYFNLWDSDGASALKQSSTSNGAGDNDTLTYNNLKAGTYYIEILNYASTNGSYTLKNVFTETSIPDGNDTEPDDTKEDAIQLTLDSSVTGHLGFYGNGSGDNYDWYKITTSKDGSLTIIGIPESSLNFYFNLWDSDGASALKQSSTSNGAGDNDTLTYNNLKAGTYYIEIIQYASTYGSYTLKNVFTETSIPDGNDTEPDDTKEDAIQLTLDSSVTGHLGFYGNGSGDNYDWYKITTSKDGSLTLIGIPESSLNFYFNLWDSDGASALKQSSTSNRAGDNDTLTYNNLKAGTYYIEMIQYASTYGSYILKNVFTETSIPDGNDTEPNDTKENALSFTLDSSVTGHLGFYGSGSGDDYDWYKITTTEEHKLTLIGIPESSLNFYLQLIDSDGSTVLSQSSTTNGAGDNDTIIYDNLPAGTYYIQMVQYASTYGSYTLKNIFSGTATTTTTLSGKVTNALDGTAISGAQVEIAGLTTTTDSNGDYTITDIPEAALTADFSGNPTSGNAPLEVAFTDQSNDAVHTLKVSANGYVTYQNDQIAIGSGETLSIDVSLTPTLEEGEMRIVLNWGQNPEDLDAHLKTPSIDGTEYSIYWNNKGSATSAPFATLDHDDQKSYGPETITITKLYDGTYKYYVYNYSGSPDITTSNAVVQVYSGSGLVKTVNIPTSGTGRYWNVLTIDGSTGAVTVVNEIVSTAPVTNPPAFVQKPQVPEEKSVKSTGSITTWNWDFGDGTTSTEQNPSHTYTTAGTYTVALTVSNGSENKTETKTDYITASGSSSGGTITSTTAGGNWGSSSTWIGGVVPTESDNVVIDGDVVLNYASTKCHDLTINEGTTLSGTDVTSAYLRIYGDFVNNGTFNFGALMYVYKSITNNGNWTTSKLYMDDTAQQVISGDSVFKVKYFYVQNGQKIVAGSDIDFDGMNMLFQGSEFEVPTGKTVSFSRYGTYETTYLDNIILKGGGSVNFDGYIYISNSKVENITLKGTITVKYTLDIGDSTHLSGTLENVKSYSGTVNLLSNFINDGVVRDHPDGGTLGVNVYKDLTNNGEWTADPYIKGDVNQTIKNTGTLNCEYFTLYANVSGATTYQWKKDNVDVYSGNPYAFNTSGDYYGTYYCQTDAGNSRTITLEGSGGNSGGGETVLSENFDETTFPPTGWTVSTTNTSNTWSRGNSSEHPFSDVDATNVASAVCPWTSENQDEWIETPVISLPSDVSTIEFYAGFSTAYLSYATLKLKISVDGGSTWTQLWEATDDGSDWSWHKISVDISSYANNSNVIFGWEYVGADGDSVGIDNVIIKQSTTGIQNHQAEMDFTLGQNYPNPFTYRTTIPFNLVHTADVKLTVYNCLGQKVAEPVSGILTAGNHKVGFDARGLNPGIYYYQLTLNGISVAKRMIHIK